MRWLRLDTALTLGELSVECSNSQLQLETIRFSRETHITLDGEQNFLVLSNCSLERLELSSHRPNNIDFRKQTALTELRATLHGSRMQARLCGFAWSSVRSYAGSSIYLYIEPQFHSRTFEFTRDSHSHILIETADEPQRSVTAEHEQWDIERSLKKILIEPRADEPVSYAIESSAAPAPTGTPQCVVCQSALPVYLLQPCSHVCLCEECAPSYREHNLPGCPLCRAPIEHIKRVFLACS